MHNKYNHLRASFSRQLPCVGTPTPRRTLPPAAVAGLDNSLQAINSNASRSTFCGARHPFLQGCNSNAHLSV